MNLHPVSIGFGIFFTGVYIFMNVKKASPVNPFNCAVFFLGGFAFIGGIELIAAAWKNDPSALPTNWAEYLGAAGAAGIGLSLEQFVKLIRSNKSVSVPSNGKGKRRNGGRG